MTDPRIAELIQATDVTTYSLSEDAREQLVPFGRAVLPAFLEQYPKLRRYQGRQALVYTAIKFARSDPRARELGRMALHDKSGRVRHFACALLAFGLNPDDITALEPLTTHRDPLTAADAAAAIDAILHRNHHLFRDRDHSGRVRWNVVGAEGL